jgi:hypothetical protein
MNSATKFDSSASPVTGRESKNKMSALITNVEHALAVAASDTVKVAKFVETSVFPVLKAEILEAIKAVAREKRYFIADAICESQASC